MSEYQFNNKVVLLRPELAESGLPELFFVMKGPFSNAMGTGVFGVYWKDLSVSQKARLYACEYQIAEFKGVQHPRDDRYTPGIRCKIHVGDVLREVTQDELLNGKPSLEAIGKMYKALYWENEVNYMQKEILRESADYADNVQIKIDMEEIMNSEITMNAKYHLLDKFYQDRVC